WIDGPFDALRQDLVPKDYIPTITQERGELLVHVQRRPKARFAGVQVNLILLIVTVLTILFFGGAWNWADYSGKPILSAESIGYGAAFFSVPLLAILGCHEMGHYVVAKRYHVRASLPFFLPSIPPLRTLGAFISMRDPIPNRRALLDIGVAGPLVGFVIAIPVTLAGLALTAATPGNALAESPQPSILFLVLSQFFPVSGAVAQHPLAFAGWVGLFVTAINLLPAGQLDGGHVARALLGRRQFYISWAAVLILFGLSAFYPGWFILGFVIRFAAYQIGSSNVSANRDTVEFRLNASQRAVLDLMVTAPASWPSALPAMVTFQVHAATPDGIASPADLEVPVQVTS